MEDRVKDEDEDEDYDNDDRYDLDIIILGIFMMKGIVTIFSTKGSRESHQN